MALLSPLLPYIRYIPAIGGLYVLYRLFWPYPRYSPSGIPYLSRIPLFAYLSYLTSGPSLLASGYRKYAPSPFAIPLPWGDEIILTSPADIHALVTAPDRILSSTLHTEWALGGRYTLPGHWVATSGGVAVGEWARRMHTLVRGLLGPEKLEWFYPAILDEVNVALGKMLPDEGEVELHDLCVGMVARVGSRVIVGKKLCRNENYIEHMVSMGKAVVVRAGFLSVLPAWLRGFVARLVMKGLESRIQAVFVPAIRELATKPDGEKTVLSEFLLIPGVSDKPDYDLRIAEQLTALNFAALHATALHLTHCFHHLAHNRSDVELLRQSLSPPEQWSYRTVTKHALLDSFLKEIQRTTPLAANALPRTVLREWALPSGGRVEAGTHVSAVSQMLLLDPNVYPEPEKVDIARFMKLRTLPRNRLPNSAQVDNGLVWGFTDTNEAFGIFGAGRHRCTGRFLAGLEIMLLIAGLLEVREIVGEGAGRKGGEWEMVQAEAKGFGWAWIATGGGKLRVRKRIKGVR